MNAQARIEALSKAPAHPAGDRVLHELRYAREVSRVDGGCWDSLIATALELLESGLRAEGILARAAAEAAEQALLPMREAAKRYTVLCVGHAHIDMNWMWRYDETVSITLDTFRTVLGFLKEYPDFRFSQSQASVYEIVEKYDPDMLEEIRDQITAGRWEVTAATWVEADRNMPSGESVARHLLYTRRYLSRLLGVDGEKLSLDYEPDTFGHNASIPELLTQGGVRYYYHCRGDEGELLYRWRSPSGAEILCYREPYWYLGPIEENYALGAPAFCARYGLDTHLRVYGVGDHGGGPTRRDIELVRELAQWPIYPKFKFGSYREFFEAAGKATGLATVTGELNSVFTGCYTSQARITQANRFGEAKLGEAESFAAQAALTAGGNYPRAAFEEAWRKVLFNQFHDILPGSGVIDTREHAMGIFSEAMAVADTQKAKALRALGAQADTSAFITDVGMYGSTAEGAGVGFGAGYGMNGVDPTTGAGAGRPFRVAQTGRGRGLNRVFHVFNPSACDRAEVVELTVFDWPGDYRRLWVLGADGEPLRFQLLDEEPKEYWQHRYARVLVEIALPAGGRSTCILTQNDDLELAPPPRRDPRVEPPFSFTLENEHLAARFCPDTGALVSLRDKAAGTELLDRPSAFFRLIQEQPAENTAGTAWTVGRYRSVENLTKEIALRKVLEGPLKSAIAFTVTAAASTVTYTVSLSAGSRWLEAECDIDWREIGVPGRNTPQLNFTLPTALKVTEFVQDIPSGLIRRKPLAQDVACQSFAAACGGSRALMLISDSKYGFRCENDPVDGRSVLSLTCLRSSTDPDPVPEVGRHHFRIGIGVSKASGLDLLGTAHAFCHPPTAVSDQPRKGRWPMEAGGLRVSGAFLQGVKLAEDADSLILRLVETEGREGEATVELWKDIATAIAVDLHEQPLAEAPAPVWSGKVLRCLLRAYGTLTLRVSLVRD